MLVRSSSLSGLHQHNSKSDEKPQSEETPKTRQRFEIKERKSNKNGEQLSWGWLLSPGRHNLRPHISDRSAFPPLRRTPILARILLKLDERFSEYCYHLSDPSIEEARMACTFIWDASFLYTTLSPKESPSSSKQNLTKNEPENTTNEIMAWLGNRSGLHAPGGIMKPSAVTRSRTENAASIIDLENEWEKYLAPLILLAGAEALFSEMQHVREKKLVRRMVWLYERVAGDLIVLKESLCDPFLLATSNEATAELRNENSTASPNQHEIIAASSIATSLLGLVAVTKVRCQMIQIQSNFFTHSEAKLAPPLVWTDIAHSFEQLMSFLPELQDSGSAMYLIEAVRLELTSWTLLLRLVHHVMRCKFAETLITAKKLKSCLKLASQAGFQVWFRSTLEDILSILPVIFDRIDAFATPRYGFDKSLLVESALKQKDRLTGSYDFESAVLDLLRRHEKSGGLAMAVAVVLDAAKTENLHIEKGYVVEEADPADFQSNMTDLTPLEMERLEWPAVFMRTTFHLGAAQGGLGRSPSASGGVFGNIRRSGSLRNSNQMLLRSGSRRELETEKPTQSNTGLNKVSRSIEATIQVVSPKNKQKKTFGLSPSSPGQRQRTSSSASLSSFNVLEYEPDIGTPGWPYSEWSTLLSLLRPPEVNIDSDEAQGQDNRSILHEEAFTFRRTERIDPVAGSDPSDDTQDEDGAFGAVFGLPSLLSAATSNAGVVASSNSSPPPSLSRPHQTTSTCFHVVRLTEFMWMVVMTKEGEEEESRWARRRPRGLGDDEILSFLNDIASKLRLEALFQVQTTTRLLNRKLPALMPTGFSFAHALEQATVHWDAQEFLRFLNESFGLRSLHPLGEGWRSPFGGRRNMSLTASAQNDEPSLLVSLPEMINDEQGAAIFFLGSELSRLLG